ncbi:tape measure protein [Alicyclobacillus kakegawensis]|uniref:tape measure protein n=1 Tax=Alicyclobacillus kakegawensis TaxID=392012 RepID=UPI0008295520|nr:tape measure protein [Alicyclobacillus kakegawensis]
MAEETYVIEIAVEALDQTKMGLDEAENRLSKFEQNVARWKQRQDALFRTQLTLKIRAIDSASKVIDRIFSRGESLARSPFKVTIKAIDLATSPIRGVMNLMSSYQAMMATAAAAGVGYAGIAWPIKLADNLTSATLGFQAMLNSAQKAKQFMSQLQDFGRITPFSTDDLIRDAQQLMNAGYGYKQVIPLLRAFGDAVSGTGGNVNNMNSVILALSQMANHGKVDAQDMSQLTSANIPAWRILAQEMHKSVAEVQNLSQKGKLEAGPAIQMLEKGLERIFGGSLEKNATLTVGGILSQYTDAFKQYIATPWGQGLQQGLLPGLSKFNDWIDKNKHLLDQWGNTLRHWGKEGAEWLTGKVKELIAAVERLTHSQAWANAPTMWDKLKLAWDDLVVVPFDRWWHGKGQSEVAHMASEVGNFFGSMLNGMIMGALGIAGGKPIHHTMVVDTMPAQVPNADLMRHLDPMLQRQYLNALQKANTHIVDSQPWIDAGQTAGSAFFHAFSKAFNADQIAHGLVQAFRNIQPSFFGGKTQSTGGDVLSMLLEPAEMSCQCS